MSGTLALMVCTALQIWRPYFFLTNDNLTQWLPPLVEIARNLQGGQPAFVSESLFGGNYDWSTDATIFPLISPLLPLLSPVARSSYYFALVDVIATFEFVVIAVSFAAAASWLRARHALTIGDGAIVTASLSYAFAPLMLLLGASWFGFINAQAAWPLVYVALQFTTAWRSILVLFAALAFSLFGGNLHPFGYLVFGGAAWALFFSFKNRTLRPAIFFGAALCLVALVVILVLGPDIGLLATAGRVRAFSPAKSSVLNVTPPALAASWFLGPLAAYLNGPRMIIESGPAWSAAIGFSLINIPTAVALCHGKWRSGTTALLVASAIVVVFIWRPDWLASLIAATPVLRATRWPFREVPVLLCFAHLLFVLNYRPLPRRLSHAAWLLALAPLLILGFSGPPTFGPVQLSRKLIISGAADEYWRVLRPSLGQRPNVVAADLPSMHAGIERVPFPLLASHNFAALFGVVSVSGYSTSSPLLLERERMLPPAVSGIYTLEQASLYLKRFPDTRLTVVHQTNPPVWSIYESGKELRMTIDPETLVITPVITN